MAHGTTQSAASGSAARFSGFEKNVAASQARLDKPDFVARAPEAVVGKERARVAEGEAQIARLKENLESLSH